jgi:phage terminase large subunit
MDITNKISSDEKIEFIKGSYVGSTNVTEQVTSISMGFQPYATRVWIRSKLLVKYERLTKK